MGTPPPRRATVKDVAALAGVSPKTVSNVMTGAATVSEGITERVLAAIDQLGYVPNYSARGLRNGRSGVIALALPDLATLYSAEVTNAFVEVAHERGWAVLIEQTARDPRREWQLLSRARAHLVDGLVLNPVTLEASALAAVEDLPPVVLIGEVQQNAVDHVEVDSVAAARAMTEHLIGLGRRRVAALGAAGPAFDSATARLRLEGYRAALAAAGIPADPSLELVVDEWSPGDAAARVARALEAGLEFDALFCFTDSMAIGALHSLAAAGKAVPADIAVAGFDDIADGRLALPALTTVAFDKRLFAERTLDLLDDRINDRSRMPRREVIPHRLVVRGSTDPSY
jgi:DNA-binding LacI/PurR family transcriptional regulator